MNFSATGVLADIYRTVRLAHERYHGQGHCGTGLNKDRPDVVLSNAYLNAANPVSYLNVQLSRTSL